MGFRAWSVWVPVVLNKIYLLPGSLRLQRMGCDKMWYQGMIPSHFFFLDDDDDEWRTPILLLFTDFG
jgi:hypothetical protein